MAKLPKHEVSSGNVFADLGLPDSEELLLKSQLVIELQRLIKLRKLTQSKAAEVTGVAQPDLSNLLKGKLRGFSVERLMLMLTTFGRDIDIVVRPASGSRKQGGIRLKRSAA